MKAWDYFKNDCDPETGKEYSRIVQIIAKDDRGKAIAWRSEYNFRQHLLHHDTSFIAFSMNELKMTISSPLHARKHVLNFKS